MLIMRILGYLREDCPHLANSTLGKNEPDFSVDGASWYMTMFLVLSLLRKRDSYTILSSYIRHKKIQNRFYFFHFFWSI